MHVSSILRMQWFVDTYINRQDKELKILDVGSYDFNGSYKPLFNHKNFRYVGLDMEVGPNVDIVPNKIYSWDEINDESYDVIISGQSFEHNEFFWLTIKEMTRILKRGGLMCIIAPRGTLLHRYPVDCWRFDADGMLALAKYAGLKPLHVSTDLAPAGASWLWYGGDRDSLLVAQKPTNWHGTLDSSSYQYYETDMEKLATGFIDIQNNFINRLNNVDTAKDIYIYGAGRYAQVVLECLINKNIMPKAAVVSDGYKKQTVLQTASGDEIMIKGFSELSGGGDVLFFTTMTTCRDEIKKAIMDKFDLAQIIDVIEQA